MPEGITHNHGLLARIILGCVVLTLFAIVDLRRHGHRATRWREYAFLLLVTSVAMLYGALNDQITSLISWEYFYYGKELSNDLGADVPPDRLAMSWTAAKVGMGATWSAGLLVGAALLIANNPRRATPRLSYIELVRTLPLLLIVVIPFSIVGGLLGYIGGLTWTSAGFREMVAMDYWRPYRFMATFGVHLGAYAGGFVGLVVCVIRVIVQRRVSVGPASA